MRIDHNARDRGPGRAPLVRAEQSPHQPMGAGHHLGAVGIVSPREVLGVAAGDPYRTVAQLCQAFSGHVCGLGDA